MRNVVCQKIHTFELTHENKSCSACPKDQHKQQQLERQFLDSHDFESREELEKSPKDGFNFVKDVFIFRRLNKQAIKLLFFLPLLSVSYGLRFASYYTDSMVLQREPARATVWGFDAGTAGEELLVLNTTLFL